jgi:hypothetical protein
MAPWAGPRDTVLAHPPHGTPDATREEPPATLNGRGSNSPTLSPSGGIVKLFQRVARPAARATSRCDGATRCLGRIGTPPTDFAAPRVEDDGPLRGRFSKGRGRCVPDHHLTVVNSPRRVGAGAGRCAGLFPWGAANVFLVHHLTVVNSPLRGGESSTQSPKLEPVNQGLRVTASASNPGVRSSIQP